MLVGARSNPSCLVFSCLESQQSTVCLSEAANCTDKTYMCMQMCMHMHMHMHMYMCMHM